MPKSIQALREQRTELARECRNLLDQTPESDWGEEHSQQYDDLMEQIDRIDGQIERMERLLDIEAANRQRLDDVRERDGVASDDEANSVLDQERRVFVSWLQGGLEALTAEQRQFVEQRRERSLRGDLATGTDTAGGFLVPTGFSRRLLEELKAFGGIRAVASVQATDSGASIEWPTVDDTAQEGELLAENTAATALDPAFGVKTIAAYKYSSKSVAVPFELLQDAEIDIEAYIIGLLGRRIARITNRHFTTGTGTGQPEGVVTGSTLGVSGTGQPTSVTYDDLVDLEHSVDPAYRIGPGVSWMFHDDTLKVLKKLKDTTGRPLWVPAVAAGEPDLLLNYRYTVNQNMPTMAANAKSILFGDFSNYLIRDVMQVTLFRMTDSAFTTKGQVGFLAMSRHDGKLMDAAGNSIKHYQNLV